MGSEMCIRDRPQIGSFAKDRLMIDVTRSMSVAVALRAVRPGVTKGSFASPGLVTGQTLLGRPPAPGECAAELPSQSILEWKKKRSLRSSLPPLNPGRESTPQMPAATVRRAQITSTNKTAIA